MDAPLDPAKDADPDIEPRWPVILAIAAVTALYYALPHNYRFVDSWVMIILVAILLVPTIVTHQQGHHKLNQFFGHLVTGVLTLFMLAALERLVAGLIGMGPKETALQVLRGAAMIWVANVLVFACWYWRLDAGGPNAREIREEHRCGAFLFPQMAMDDTMRDLTGQSGWAPGFVDYLFLAFNTSAAFSPTDTFPLTRWSKLLMMVQSMVSLTIVVLVAARGVNILS